MTEAYSRADGILRFGAKVIGADHVIYVDAAQARDLHVAAGKAEGFTVIRLPVGDYVFMTHSGKIVAVEEKKYGDLISSYARRRLQRQLRQCLTGADIAILAMRAENDLLVAYPMDELMVDLIKWQVLGGYIGYLPASAHAVLQELASWRTILQPSRATLSVIAGSDVQKPKTPGTPVSAAIQRLITGVGPVTGSKLAEAFGQNLLNMLSATDAALTKAGAHRGIITKLRALVPQ